MKTLELPFYIGDIVEYDYLHNGKVFKRCVITKITINRQGIYYKFYEDPYGKYALECRLEDAQKYFREVKR